MPALADLRRELGALVALHDEVSLRTERETQFIDVTELVTERVRRSGRFTGLLCVQSAHTTAGLLVNENEPRLLRDLARTLERIAPAELRYDHDDLAARGPGLAEAETPNGKSHCRALVLLPSVELIVRDGALALGRWQRLFLVELDGPRPRTLRLLLLGVAAGAG